MSPSVHKKEAVDANKWFNAMGRWHAKLAVSVDEKELTDLQGKLNAAIEARDADAFEKAMRQVYVKEKVIGARKKVQYVTVPLDYALGTARNRPYDYENSDGNRTPGFPTYQADTHFGDVGVLRAASDTVFLGLGAIGLGGVKDDNPWGIPFIIAAAIGAAGGKIVGQGLAAPSAAIKQSTNSLTRLAVSPIAKMKAQKARARFEESLLDNAALLAVQNAAETASLSESVAQDGASVQGDETVSLRSFVG